LHAQLLHPSTAAKTAHEAVERAIIQAQDARAARLGIRARSTGLTEGGVERERLEDRSFVRAWAMRGTIHLISSEDYPWIRDLVAPPLIPPSQKRMAQEGMTPAMAERARPIVRKLLQGGPATRAEMREALARRRIRPKGRQALVHLLFLMTYEGEIVTGPYVGTKETMVLARDWLGRRKPRSPKDPAAELARRYLLGYGPATIEDFRWWSGLRAADARSGWAALGDELVEEGTGLWRLRSQGAPAGRPAPVRLLPMWDHYFLGYRDRTHVGPPEVVGGVGAGGVFNPLVVADGRAVATWKLNRRGGGYGVGLEPLGRMPAKSAIASEAAEISRFLGSEVTLG
jgi:hypothetical protein